MGAACATASLRHWDSPTKKGYVGFDVYVSQESKKSPCVASAPPSAVSAPLPRSVVKSALPSGSNFPHVERNCIKTELSILLPGFSASQMYLPNTQEMPMTSCLMFLHPTEN